MEYKIIEGNVLRFFEEKVIKHLNDGWKLKGQCFVNKNGDFCQTLYKEKTVVAPCPITEYETKHILDDLKRCRSDKYDEEPYTDDFIEKGL